MAGNARGRVPAGRLKGWDEGGSEEVEAEGVGCSKSVVG